ncbi:unnamed protein product, partial [Rotaria sp. Silwood2]
MKIRGQHAILLISLLSLLILTQLHHLVPNAKQKSTTASNKSSNDNVQLNSRDYINVGFSEFEFLQSKQHEIEIEQKYNLTAILLHWKRSTSVARAVNYLVDSNLFKEVIIWNNNPNINLNKTIFKKNNHSLDSIRIINSKENLKDEAKYRACAEANTMGCFYVDDDWDAS